MTYGTLPLSERVASYYAQLTSAAKDLNSISDELGKSIAEIDMALKKLNLGVAVWVPIRKEDGPLPAQTPSLARLGESACGNSVEIIKGQMRTNRLNLGYSTMPPELCGFRRSTRSQNCLRNSAKKLSKPQMRFANG